MRPIDGAAVAALLALLVLIGFGARAADETPAADAKPPAVKIAIHYLTKEYEEPVPLSLVDPILKDNGLQGARLAIQDNNKSGQLLGQEYELVEDTVPADGDVAAKAKEILKDGPAIIIADLEAKDLLAVADLPEAKDSIIFNIRSGDDRLRGEDCRFNVFHIAPTWSMRADALAQYLIWKKWNKWFVLKGVAPSDQDYDAAVKRAAGRFGGKVVEEREYKFDTANPRTDSGHQQIQTQMPEVTQGAPEHDVLWVVDTVEHFGEYVPYRDYDPRPVVGTQGLIAVAWHRSYEQYAGTQMQHRFERFAKRVMTERDYSAWIAVRAVGEAVTRSGKSDVADIRAYILSDAFTVAAFKGEGLSFRSWDHQLRQPLLITGARSLVSMSPQEGFLHPKNLTDTLGYDEPETKCKFPK
ncbi:MAG TPA: ABC transporter substrate-binding protein [Methyloceanibacter sp.]|nr:ABC transporter substrate-binding protein [Methyloceanibacter sp.]